MSDTSDNVELDLRRKNSRLLVSTTVDPTTLGPIVGYAEEPLLPLHDACAPLSSILPDISAHVTIALASTPDHPSDGLTRDESAAIHLYTMEWPSGNKSLYTHLNYTLKTAHRQQLIPWHKYLKLFLTALAKLPCAPPQTVWRGVKKDISNEFMRGASVIWWSFSSCTMSLSMLESDLYLGNTGERTLFSIEVFNGRNIRAHSAFDTEDEVLLLPGTYMVVKSLLNPAPDMHIIHMKQEKPEEVLLELPFESNMSLFSCECIVK